MTFLEIHHDPSSSDVQLRPPWSRRLRKQLLWDLLRVEPSGSTDYSSWFQKVSTLGPVLIVLDNVHKLGQFETLIPFASDLHPGSRIFVTSRDRSTLNNVTGRTEMDHRVFDVSTLDAGSSSRLFNWHNFNCDRAPEDYEELAKDVVKACGGLPLALKVTGSSLFDRRSDGDRETIWPEAVHALRQTRDVMDVLRWSYDRLPESEKRMFVDITCLFNDWNALAYWGSCENCTSCGGVRTPHTSLRNLIDKSLVKVGSWRACFSVHDLLEDLGQEIGQRTRRHLVRGEIAEATIRK